jgi:hypothetical protein
MIKTAPRLQWVAILPLQADRGFGSRKQGKGQDRLKVREKADLGLFQNLSLSESGRDKGGADV